MLIMTVHNAHYHYQLSSSLFNKLVLLQCIFALVHRVAAGATDTSGSKSARKPASSYHPISSGRSSKHGKETSRIRWQRESERRRKQQQQGIQSAAAAPIATVGEAANSSATGAAAAAGQAIARASAGESSGSKEFTWQQRHK